MHEADLGLDLGGWTGDSRAHGIVEVSFDS